MVKLVLSVVLLFSIAVTIQGASNTASNNQLVNQLEGLFNQLSGFLTVFSELFVNLKKVWQLFTTELITAPNSLSTIPGSPLLFLATTNETQSCTSVEGQNLLTLISNTTGAIEHCLGNFTSDGGVLISGFYNVFSNVTQLIRNATSNISHCIETNQTYRFLEIPVCVVQQLRYVGSVLSVVLQQVNQVIIGALNFTGRFANTIRSCIIGIVSQFLSNIYNILIDFVTCIEQL